jgi:hypothetical protein
MLAPTLGKRFSKNGSYMQQALPAILAQALRAALHPASTAKWCWRDHQRTAHAGQRVAGHTRAHATSASQFTRSARWSSAQARMIRVLNVLAVGQAFNFNRLKTLLRGNAAQS